MEVPSRRDEIATSLSAVRQRLARALERAGRSPSSARLVAISKTRPAQDVRAAFDAGQLEFGENRVQEALEKIAATSDIPIAWHLVGHLQSNKARRAAVSFACIHSIDSVELLTRVDAAAAEAGRRTELLVQVDLAGEATKHGAPAETWLVGVRGGGGMPGGAGDGTDAAAAVHAGSRGRQAVFQAAQGASGRAGRARRAAGDAPRAVDGHEPRFRGRRRRRGHHRPGGHGHLRRTLRPGGWPARHAGAGCRSHT